MSLVHCTIHGDCDESGSQCSFHLPSPVTLTSLQKIFPYEGEYRFRLKMPGSMAGFKEGYVWLDLTDSNVVEFSSCMSKDEIYIQALVISLPESARDDLMYDTYLDSVDASISQYTRANRHPVVEHESENHKNKKEKSGIVQGKEMLKMISKGVRSGAKTVASNAHNLNLGAVQKGAASIWSTVRKIQQSMSANEPLSDIAEENLSHLSEDVSTSFVESDPVHVSLLSNLWEVLFPVEGPFQRNSPVWKDAGFQKTDPVSDLKASGVLSIRAMTYLGVKYPLKAQSMLNNNKINTKTNYPFAVVGINITLLLAELLNLRDQRYLSTSAGYWGTFEDDSAFFELFCLSFLQMDSIWTHRKAVRTDFGQLIGEVKALVSSVLSRSPRSIGEMRAIAAEEGMVTFSSTHEYDDR